MMGMMVGATCVTIGMTRKTMRKLDLAFFLVGETALTNQELYDWAKSLGWVGRPPGNPDLLVRAKAVKDEV
jgi:hypothetical protein